MKSMNTIPWGCDRLESTSDAAALKNWGYWQNRINRASLVMLHEEGIVTDEEAKTIAQAQSMAEMKQASMPPLSDIVPLEKLLIEYCGQLATLIHTGRSRQDIFATLNQARLREAVMDLSENLNAFRRRLLTLAEAHTETWMPAYTNGVQAMPITLAFYLSAFLESFERDADRLQSLWQRVNRCALGTGVLACSSWPLNRSRLAELLGFDEPIENGLDSSQVSLFDVPLEAASVAGNIAVRIGTLMQDIAQQYSQTRPWLLVDSSAAYASSAMPQKRNPGIIQKTRAKASDVVGEMQTAFIRAHNLNLGMYDNKESVSEDNTRVFVDAVHTLKLADWAFSMLRVHPDRALEELESDWTTTMALAEVLQHRFHLPFRVGHNFSSEMVTAARQNGWIPKSFPYSEAQKIYREVTLRLEGEAQELPLRENELHESLSPAYVVKSRIGSGSPAPEMVSAMLRRQKKHLEADEMQLQQWRNQQQTAQKMLDQCFEALKN